MNGDGGKGVVKTLGTFRRVGALYILAPVQSVGNHASKVALRN